MEKNSQRGGGSHSSSQWDSSRQDSGDEALPLESGRRIGRADVRRDSDLPNGRREMSSSYTNQMIRSNNNTNFVVGEKDKQQLGPAGDTDRQTLGQNDSDSTWDADRGASFSAQSDTRRSRQPANRPSEPRQQQQQPHQATQNRGRFIKSKSSPSSLTTHKFGLRPTPSPPRLIIDHQTGDIVESYPEHPIYLRTYQPIEPADDFSDHDSYPERLQASNPTPRHQQSDHRVPYQMANVPPPPHAAAKVYFAPPATNSSPFGDQPSQAAGRHVSTPSSRERARASFRKAINQLAETAERTDIAIVTEPDDYDRTAQDRCGSRPPGQIRVTATSASKGEALLAQQRRPLNQQQQSPPATSSAANKLYSQPSLRRAGQNQRQHQPAANGKKGALYHGDTINQPPTIEDFNLYGFCFWFRVLLVLFLSGSIIYLFVFDLHDDCLKYKPSSTYVSIITSSVNIISVTVFTLFWYCSGVTRTLYQNISASAFIVTMYTILVCINLALAILFFFIDTCHFQKVIATHSVLVDWERFSQPVSDDGDGGGGNGGGLAAITSTQHERAKRQHDERVALEATRSIDSLLNTLVAAKHNSWPQHSKRETNSHNTRREALNDDPTVIDDQLSDQDQQEQPTTASTTTSTTTQDSYLQDSHAPEMSPIEAAWRYLKERARAFARSFYRFLVHYDLKFIGALHALLAACFQYLAIKVAVVRSYFSSSAASMANF